MPGLGTAINVMTIAGGTVVGLLAGRYIPERSRTTMLQAVGLVTLALGVGQTIGTRNLVFPLVALVLGGLAGEALGLEDRLESLGERVRRRLEGGAVSDAGAGVDAEVEGAAGVAHLRPDPPEGGSTFVEGFVAASLLFCVGPLAILGSVQDGLSGDIEILVVKAALDGLVSAILAATLGWGVGFSILAVLAYQGALTLAAASFGDVLNERMVVELTAAGGVMVMGIGLRLLEVKPVRVGSLLPALALVPLLVAIFAR